MKKIRFQSIACCLLVLFFLFSGSAYAQSGFADDRVMLQGFYWESYRHGMPERFPDFGAKKWYEIVKEQAHAVHAGRFDLIWLPPPSFAGEVSAGYNPKEYFNLNNTYGSLQQHRSMIESLLQYGIEPIADIVINHRDGALGWADFKNPDWGTSAITANDEAFSNPDSEVYQTPKAERGAAEESPADYAGHGGTTYGYGSFRDLDHTNKTVRRDIIRYLLQLKSLGYRGWRYDMVHGYHARWIAVYNRASKPTFSLGEYDWAAHPEQRGWIWHSATTPDDMATVSSIFDFTTFFTLKDNKGNYSALYGYGNGIGMMGDTTDGLPWKNKAVTFLKNHDTGYRTNEDGSAQENHDSEDFLNDWQVEQGYAYILTHPGLPTVFWTHYFDWGEDLRNKITALINARKVAGVHAGSTLHTQHNARQKGVYGARIVGKFGDLYIRIGGSDMDWQPFYSNYHGYQEYAHGSGWKVWVKLPENPPVRQAPFKEALPVPQYHGADTFEVSDDQLN